jgi:hypothetical protein
MDIEKESVNESLVTDVVLWLLVDGKINEAIELLTTISKHQ